MSCSQCLNSEKQSSKCVFDEDGKSLDDTLKEIGESLSTLKDNIDVSTIDGKTIISVKDSKNIVNYLQDTINVLAKVSSDLEKKSNPLDKKLNIPELGIGLASVEDILKTLSIRIGTLVSNKSQLFVP